MAPVWVWTCARERIGGHSGRVLEYRTTPFRIKSLHVSAWTQQGSPSVSRQTQIARHRA